ncbi:MFS transporter [Maritimibacter sp. UBA3975]|uniref:MFS transporter n=1 Tax=Maritimibacter sp. UBA3975 TaxID=1946833 RepID=UPI000C09B511|nr:MFS transporter [Maritimibacter sp. UBA3975]MAM63356.1 MFS transporter [Maritimibacter sp.]|tara:strand:+ start:5212 stop:6426 length:1215 start_codon:yes stop_codon:yes gene_type:complete
MVQFLVTNFRWLATGFLLTFASSFGQTWFISLFAGEIREAHGLTNGGWGGLYTIATLASAALLFSRGALVDTMRLSRLTVAICLLFALAAAIMALAPSVWLLGIGVFLLRFCGQGMMSHMAITSMGRWFHATRGRAVAIASLGHPLGEAILPLFFVGLIGALGWRETWGIAAGAILIGVLPLALILLARDRQPQGEAVSGDASAGLEGRHWQRRDLVRHWLFFAILPLFLTPPFIGTVIFFQQVNVAEVKGWTLAEMAPGYVVWASVSVASGLIAGWACDRFGPERLMPVLLLPMGAGLFLLAPAQVPQMWFAVLGIVAVTQGAVSSFLGAFLPRVYGTRHLGAVRSLQTVIMVISTAIGPGITGVMIDAGVSFPVQGVALALWCMVLSAGMVPVAIRLRRELA